MTSRPPVNSVIAIPLDDRRWVHARVLRDASIGFYHGVRNNPSDFPSGDRDCSFVVGVYDDVIASPSWIVVGVDRARDEDDEWPPPRAVRDKITGVTRLYYKGEFRSATPEEAESLEVAAVWDREHIMARIRRDLLGES